MNIKTQLAKSLSILIAAAKRSLTAFIDKLNCSFSLIDKLISTTFSTPFFPIITGTPAYKSFVPYSPLRCAAH